MIQKKMLKEVKEMKKINLKPNENKLEICINQQSQEVLHASCQISIKQKTCIREKIRIQIQTKILDENGTEEFLDEICNDLQKATQLLQGKEAPSLFKNTVQVIYQKYKDIQQLEKSIVYYLFVDFAILIHAQGQQMDNIEIRLGSAKTEQYQHFIYSIYN